MSQLTLTDEENEVSVEVEFEHLARRLGDEYILDSDEDPEFAYLAALALETQDNPSYSVEDTLMEFIRNSSELENVTVEACEEIEALLK